MRAVLYVLALSGRARVMVCLLQRIQDRLVGIFCAARVCFLQVRMRSPCGSMTCRLQGRIPFHTLAVDERMRKRGPGEFTF